MGDPCAARAHAGRMLLPADARYPDRLHDLERPPAALHLRRPAGPERLAVLLADPVVAVVGAREATAEGRAFAHRLAGELAGAGVAVVSGLARGIDAAAHAGALVRGGRTAAVLGCGIDRDYPRATAHLAAVIAREGAVLSEYAPGTPPAPFRFPERNRIVAALAQCVVVVEAHARSGALITARLALELGRDVLAVPGAPWQPAAAGTLALLRDGAHPCLGAADVLIALGLDPGRTRADDPALGADARRLLACLRREEDSDLVLARRAGLGDGAFSDAVLALVAGGLVRRRPDGRLVPNA
ncbi:MAG: DNA-processing protein DprA [Actinomycetota bacterium]